MENFTDEQEHDYHKDDQQQFDDEDQQQNDHEDQQTTEDADELDNKENKSESRFTYAEIQKYIEF